MKASSQIVISDTGDISSFRAQLGETDFFIIEDSHNNAVGVPATIALIGLELIATKRGLSTHEYLTKIADVINKWKQDAELTVTKTEEASVQPTEATPTETPVPEDKKEESDASIQK